MSVLDKISRVIAYLVSYQQISDNHCNFTNITIYEMRHFTLIRELLTIFSTFHLFAGLYLGNATVSAFSHVLIVGGGTAFLRVPLHYTPLCRNMISDYHDHYNFTHVNFVCPFRHNKGTYLKHLRHSEMVIAPTQYRLYVRRFFTGQKNQPTVSKYWRKS